MRATREIWRPPPKRAPIPPKRAPKRAPKKKRFKRKTKSKKKQKKKLNCKVILYFAF